MKLPAFSLCLGLVTPFTAHALDVNSIDINGFGSIIGSMTLDDGDRYYTIDNDLDFQSESLFAVQISSQISEKWSATTQILARGETDFEPTFVWAYLAYQATDDLKFFFGRQRFKQYKYSAYVDVGYAYPWLRLPQAVYSIPFSSGDGVGATYQTFVGDLEVNLQYNALGVGFEDYRLPGNTTGTSLELQLSHIFSVDMNYEDFNFGFNIGHIPELSYDLVGANPALAAIFETADAVLPPSLADEVRELRADDVTITSYDIYAGWDNGVIFGVVEYSKSDYTASALPSQEAWYVTGGGRIGQYTLHATYGHDKNIPSADVADDVERLASQVPQLAPLAAGVRGLQDGQKQDSKFCILGVRYDFDTAVALKADYTMVDDDDPTIDMDVIAVGLDFVF